MRARQHDLRGIARIHQVLLRRAHLGTVVVGRDRACDQIRVADLRVDNHDRHARLLCLAQCRLDLTIVHRIEHQQVDILMQQIAYLRVLPLLIERRITRQQNIAVAFDHQPQFLVNDAVKRVVHRHVRIADAERLVRLRYGLMRHGGKSDRQQQRRCRKDWSCAQRYPAFPLSS